MKIHEGVSVYSHAVTTPADGGNRSTSRHGRLTLGVHTPGYLVKRRVGGPQSWSSGCEEKNFFLLSVNRTHILPASSKQHKVLFSGRGGGGKEKKDGLWRPKYVKNFNYVERDTVQECCIYSWKNREGENLSNSKTRQNKDIKNTNGLVSSYRNFLNRESACFPQLSDWKGFTRNTARTPEETPQSSWPRRLITQLQCSCYAYNPPGTFSFSVKARNNSSISREVRRCVTDSWSGYCVRYSGECQVNLIIFVHPRLT